MQASAIYCIILFHKSNLGCQVIGGAGTPHPECKSLQQLSAKVSGLPQLQTVTDCIGNSKGRGTTLLFLVLFPLSFYNFGRQGDCASSRLHHTLTWQLALAADLIATVVIIAEEEAIINTTNNDYDHFGAADFIMGDTKEAKQKRPRGGKSSSTFLTNFGRMLDRAE